MTDTQSGRPWYRHESGIAWTNHSGSFMFTSASGMTEPDAPSAFRSIYESITDELSKFNQLGTPGDTDCKCADASDEHRCEGVDGDAERDNIIELKKLQALFYTAWQLRELE